eukprot:TRINITY_DN16925_c0_g1_i1.p1 TRINITY_DN16925_c0_g1~~TRINITY_DN16925_c0_g1_i1.p1  ORF type:complete len:193 (+),score=36.51 TRINITY_DN16925_c0_g1_i1:38-580(+)
MRGESKVKEPRAPKAPATGRSKQSRPVRPMGALRDEGRLELADLKHPIVASPKELRRRRARSVKKVNNWSVIFSSEDKVAEPHMPKMTFQDRPPVDLWATPYDDIQRLPQSGSSFDVISVASSNDDLEDTPTSLTDTLSNGICSWDVPGPSSSYSTLDILKDFFDEEDLRVLDQSDSDTC